MTKHDFKQKCALMSKSELEKLPEYKQIPKEINVKSLTTKELCKVINIVHQANKDGSSRQFFGLLNMIGGDTALSKSLKIQPQPQPQQIIKDCNANTGQLPSQFIRIINPSRKLYHGRSVTRSAGVWESENDFKKIMWWAVERITPLMYASTSIKGRSLDPFYRWDIYEAHVKEPLPFLVMNKKSVMYFMENPEISEMKCEGKTVGKWLKKAFPIKNGKLKRRSHIDSDRKMAICLCSHLHCVGYIANQIQVVDGPGKLHKEVMICVPQETLKLDKYMTFSTKAAQLSVERYLNESTTKLLPDEIKIYS